jgi:hypothetical protein
VNKILIDGRELRGQDLVEEFNYLYIALHGWRIQRLAGDCTFDQLAENKIPEIFRFSSNSTTEPTIVLKMLLNVVFNMLDQLGRSEQPIGLKLHPTNHAHLSLPRAQ